MPIITFEGGKLTKEQKSELIHRFTEVASKATKVPSNFFAVTIKELEDENLGFGGETIAEMKERLMRNK